MKKIVFSLCLALAGLAFIVPTSTVSAQTTQQKPALTAQEKYQVCCELENRRIIDLVTALQLERAGVLTIEKLGNGEYRVITPGINIAILIESN